MLNSTIDWTFIYITLFMLGIVLVMISITADAFLPNLQEKYFLQGASRTELTFYTNLLVLMGMTALLLISGDLQVRLLFFFSLTYMQYNCFYCSI